MGIDEFCELSGMDDETTKKFRELCDLKLGVLPFYPPSESFKKALLRMQCEVFQHISFYSNEGRIMRIFTGISAN